MTQAHADDRTVLIDSTTVIGFFPPVTKSDLEKNDDLNEVLSDFQYHLRSATPLLKKKHVRVVELYVKEFSYALDGKNILFRPEQEVGYLIVAPGRYPKAVYGVMTDVDMGDAIDAFLNAK